jgi:hypothetical protein
MKVTGVDEIRRFMWSQTLIATHITVTICAVVSHLVGIPWYAWLSEILIIEASSVITVKLQNLPAQPPPISTN